jgi:two-component system NarL family sensor kinase
VQELLNNGAKHAKASQVLVQLAMTDDELSLTLEDNGTGFDTNVINQVRGAGWANIRSRVNFLNGKLDIQSAMGTGTSVHITLPKS